LTLSTKWISRIKTRYHLISFSKVKLISLHRLNHFNNNNSMIQMHPITIYQMTVETTMTQCYRWKCNKCHQMLYKVPMDNSFSSILFVILLTFLEMALLDKISSMSNNMHINKIMIKLLHSDWQACLNHKTLNLETHCNRSKKNTKESAKVENHLEKTQTLE